MPPTAHYRSALDSLVCDHAESPDFQQFDENLKADLAAAYLATQDGETRAEAIELCGSDTGAGLVGFELLNQALIRYQLTGDKERLDTALEAFWTMLASDLASVIQRDMDDVHAELYPSNELEELRQADNRARFEGVRPYLVHG